jgi:hypothetical protein
MVPYHQDPKHAAPLHEAPRCQHTRLNGQNCGSPALRGESHCHFHNRIQDRALAAEDREPFLPFVEDATSLQFALMRVIRLLLIGHSFEYKRAALLLYSLQIAASNLKALMAEHPKPELAEGEQPQPKPVNGQKGEKTNGKNGAEPGSLAELLLGFLAKPEGDPNAPAPRIRSREDYYAAVEQRGLPNAASSGETSSP